MGFFGAWDLGLGISLVLGCWSLELFLLPRSFAAAFVTPGVNYQEHEDDETQNQKHYGSRLVLP